MKTRRPLAVLAKVGLALTVAVACMAQAPKPKVGTPEKLGPRADKGDKKPDEFRIKNADNGRMDTRKKMHYLWGNVEFEDKDIAVVCDEAYYNEKDDTARCAGHLKVTDSESVITGNDLNADFGAEMAVVTGKVTIVTTREAKREEGEGGGATEKKVTTISCDRLNYSYGEGKRRAIATGAIKAVQDDRTVIAQKADYDREKDIIVLTDDVTITRDDGSVFHCKQVTVSPTEDWIQMQGGFKGTVVRDKKKTGG